MTDAIKHDKGKLRWDLLPIRPIVELVKVYTFGAEKYGDRNWENGLPDDRWYAAVMRHIASWRMGEKHDPESGLHHLAHAMFGLVAIMFFEGLPDGVGNKKGSG